MLQFTKNRTTGRFDVIGLESEMSTGIVQVTKKDGSTTEAYISRLSKPFVSKFGSNKGKKCVIGTVSRRCVSCGTVETFNNRGLPNIRIYKSGECSDCYQERKMGY